MRPCQLGRHCRHNLFVWKFRSKLHHASDASQFKSLAPILCLQLSRHLRNNLLSIRSTLITKYFNIHAMPDVPIHHRKSGIGGRSHTCLCRIYDQAKVVHQLHHTRSNIQFFLHTLYSSPNSSFIFFSISFCKSSASALSFENSPFKDSISSRNSLSVIPSSSITTPT